MQAADASSDGTIRRFNPATIRPGSVCVAIGRRGTGKTTLLQDLVYTRREAPYAWAFSGSEGANDAWSTCIPYSFCFDRFRPDMLDMIMAKQELNATEAKFYPGRTVQEALVIVDDLSSDIDARSSESLDKILYNGRHFGVTFFVGQHDALLWKPCRRNQVDFIFILKQPSRQHRVRIWEAFFGMLSFEEFELLHEKLTNNFGCIVLNNKTTSNRISDQVFAYRATVHKSFAVGCTAFWQCHYAIAKTPQEILEEKRRKWREMSAGEESLQRTEMLARGLQSRGRGRGRGGARGGRLPSRITVAGPAPVMMPPPPPTPPRRR